MKDDLMGEFFDYLLLSGRVQEIVAILEKNLNEIDTPGLWTTYGVALSMTSQPLRAREAFLRALALAPDDDSIFEHLLLLEPEGLAA